MKIKDITLKSSREIEVIESAINFLNKNLFDNKEYQKKLSARQMLEIAQEEFKEGSYLEVWER